MEALKKERTPLRTAFTKTANSLDDELKKDVYDEVAVNTLMKQLEDKFARLIAVEDLILEKLRDDEDVSEDAYSQEFEAAEAYRDRLSLSRAQVEKTSPSQTTQERHEEYHSTSGDVGALNNQRKYQLPKIEFKQFSGDIRDWIAFWSQFQKIHLDNEVAAEDKFQYLRQATVEGSKAREVVDSFPQSAENYPKAIDHIKSRFGNEDTLVEVYVRELLRLVLNNAMNQKMKISLVSLYDKLEAQLRALETLGVTTDKFASILYPLVESCLPEDVLRAWERSKVTVVNSASSSGAAVTPNRLSSLMTFLRSEVDGEERISLARAGFGLSESKGKFGKRIKEESETNVPTAAGLFSGNQSSVKKSHICIFCDKEHESHNCFQARKMTLDDKKKCVHEKRACFICLNRGHISKYCKSKHQCQVCFKRHYATMCPELPYHKAISKKNEEVPVSKTEDLANQMCSADVSLQTLMVRVVGNGQEKLVRAIIDTGSQRTYVSAVLVNSLNLREVGQEKIVHSLFGGVESKEQLHHVFEIRACNLERSYNCRFKALDQPVICGSIPRVSKGSWMADLSKEKIILSDVGEGSPEIQLLIGSDIAGKLFTGKKYQMSNGLVALETYLGWTLLGKIPESHPRKNNVLLSLLSKESSISDLWKLETIGIMDSAEKKNKLECQQSAMDHFEETVKVEGDGRVEVSLPWIEGHPPLKENRMLAEKRLISMTKKLSVENRKEYQKIFDNWEEDKIIERVPVDELEKFGHFLPHRPVFNPASKTTPVRPCFDASAKEKNSVSLNDCLEKGPNLLEMIPAVLSRFRMNRLGVVTDIKKAFLQIGVHAKDRDFLRFLWWEKGDPEKIAVYRHRRVVFGVSSSPFLLGATLNHVLDGAPKCLQPTAEKLKSSLYVDNCLASFNSEMEVTTFVKESVELLSAAQFDLRGWIYSKEFEKPGETSTPVLGLVWNLLDDTLSCDMSSISDFECEVVTKRNILSAAHRVFDPIGFTSPLLLCPKLFLQELWKAKIGWDEPLPDGISKKFTMWVKQLSVLSELKIPRWIEGTDRKKEKWTLHTFCDASKLAFAACVFIRVEKKEKVVVHLIQAKARVAPIMPVSIPRLELLACVIGARLASNVKADLGLEDIPSFYWTDSMNALFWIKNEDAWGTFVWNRVKEIRSLSRIEDWRHVPGVKNPADLPSRGCSATQLVDSKWWEGPIWLKDATDNWLLDYDVVRCDQDVINSEKKKIVVSSLAGKKKVSTEWLSGISSKYIKILRVVALIRRFIRKVKERIAERKEGSSSAKETPKFECIAATEMDDAEKTVVKLIQMESFKKDDSCISNLQAFEDSEGMLRVRTRIFNREDDEDFRSPYVLPSHHVIVDMLIKSKHEELSHCGVQVLMSSLREKFWIVKSRRTIRSVVGKCVKCRRFQSSPISSVPTALPKERVSDAAVFQVTGVDLTGPLFLKNGQKCWIVLFTCAFYRAIHLELVLSLSTEAFLQALRRFICRRGRPSVIYSDNGTNFVGAENLFKKLDWNEIEVDASVQRIEWKFIPPSAPWWGGWWERLIGLVKSLLRRVLGRARLEYEELLTILCDSENVVNSRPLTYVSEDVNDLVAITPMMFLQDLQESRVPELDAVDAEGLNRKYRYRLKLREDLRCRFRREYLSQLVHQRRGKGDKREVTVGDIVYVGSDNSKRLDWPLGRVLEVFPGKDGHVRVARVKTSSGVLTRPVQRLFPLEVSSRQRTELSDDCVTQQISENDDLSFVTRFGRKVRKPDRLNLINFVS